MSETKTRFDCEAEAFEKAFKSKKGMKIAIYGTGRLTATLLSRVNGFQIVGLLDRDASMVGKEIYGYKVISREEAESKADILIINTSETYWGTIYQRIQDWNLPIYFKNGEIAAKSSLCRNREDSYWKRTYEDLAQKVQEYEIISFDIFDTLIMRKVFLPTDIFCIIERNFGHILNGKFNFVETRKRVESSLENATIDEIYAEMQKIEGWSDELRDSVKQYEIEAEKQFIIPRKDMVRLYNTIKDTKTIYFISDMYLTKDILEGILADCGIAISKERIIVSCDYKKSKAGGKLWKHYAEACAGGKKALHIGDNEKADGELPNKYGIDSFVVWSAEKMFQMSSVADMASDIIALHSSVLTGMLGAKLLNSPFALCRTQGKISFENEHDAGYCLLGNMVYIFCRWLMERVRENGVKQLVFFAREGYLLNTLFKDYCQFAGEENIPDIIYLEISRRAVMVASIQDMEDVYEVAEYFPYTGKFKDFLKDRFGVAVDDESLAEIDYESICENKQKLKKLLKRYEKEILLEANRERCNYLAYLESVGLCEKFAVIDSQLYGAAQYYMGKLLGKKLKGYYFCACLDSSNRYLERNIMEGCFPGKKGLDGKDASIYKNTVFIEAFFTSPNGMLECIEDTGKKKYSEKKKNQMNFAVRFEMLEGIRQYLKDMISLSQKYQIDIKPEDIYFTDRLFGIFMNNGFEPTEKMKKSFFYDNGITNSKETQLWG